MKSRTLKSMQILIPISGHSSFFPKSDYYFPKPLVEIAGTPMIEVVVKQLQRQFNGARFIFVIDPEDARSFSLDRTLMLLSGETTVIIEKPGATSGALCSCLLSLDALDLNEPLIISNCDQLIDYDLANALDIFGFKEYSAGVLTFDSIHPRWSYVVEDDQGDVIQTFEKKVASRNAIAGFYYFKSASIFLEAAKQVVLNNAHVDNIFYISSSLNEVILSGGRVVHVPILGSKYHSFYSPGKISEFERTAYAKELRNDILTPKLVNLIIPAAGEGSRFAKKGWKKPKPFIDVDGHFMLERVIQNVKPKDSEVTILLRQEHLETQSTMVNVLEENDFNIIPVSRLTEGTASTVLLARQVINNDRPMLIANSDQLVEFNVDHFIDDCFQRKLDGSILVFRDPTMDPKWSYVKVDQSGIVLEVAEKKPISDLATVGIYFFSSGNDFVGSALDMIVANDRVNNEFYTCPVYNYMIMNGARIGIYEVPISAMSGLGTPDDLNQFLHQRGARPSLDSPA